MWQYRNEKMGRKIIKEVTIDKTSSHCIHIAKTIQANSQEE